MNDFDTIVVGAGSAGCVLAGRLTEDPAHRVLLLEAGGDDSSPLIGTPASYLLLQDSPFDWAFRTVPQRHLNGRRIFSPRGRVLGGSSSINYMMYVRGNARDFDSWRDLDNPGWGHADVLPYFKRAEGNRDLHDRWHGRDGPLVVTSVPAPHPLVPRFLEAAQQAGLPFNADFNGAEQTGCGPFQRTIGDGVRCSSAGAYLRPAQSRRNLTIATHASATRLLMAGNGRIGGVEYIQDHQVHRAFAGQEVVLCAGAFQSPQLLMLSGIGPAQALERVGVRVVHDLPGVGSNLQDHLAVSVGCEVNEPVSFFAFEPAAREAAAAEYAQAQSGPLAGNFREAGAFAPREPGEDWPSLQLVFFTNMPLAYAEAGLPHVHGMTLSGWVSRPRSRGTVTLASADPLDRPVIDPNYLGDPDDVAALMAAVRWSLSILGARAFDAIRGARTYPATLPADDASLEAHVRSSASTVWHVCGTCRMGPDPQAVVDAQLRVHGLAGLRVADASVMPRIVSANTNAAVVMIAEKASDMIRGRPPLREPPAPAAPPRH